MAEVKSDEEQKEPELEIEIPSDVEAIEAATNALGAVEGYNIMTADETAIIKRIKKNCLFVLDKAMGYLREPYEEREEED